MPGPTIMVRILGDLSNLAKSFDGAKGKATEASSSISSTFGSMLSTLNKGGLLGPLGESLATANDAFGELADKAKGVGTAMLGLGGAFVGVGTGLAILGSKDQAARQQLQATIDATGKSWADYSAQVEEAIKHNERFGDSASQTMQALQILTAATNDPAKALQLLQTAADLAAAKHESLSEAATQLAKVYAGSTKLLKQFGIEVDSAKGATRDAATATHAAERADTAAAAAKQKLADMEAIDATRKKLTATQAVSLHNAQQKVVTTTRAATDAHQKATAAQQAAQAATKSQASAMDQLSQKLSGQASAASDTFTGKLKALTTHIEDQAAAFGNKYGPALQVAGQGFAVLGGAVEIGKSALDKFKAAREAANEVDKAGVAANEALAASEGLSLGPILLVIAALAALGVAAYEIYTHWTAIWGGIKAAAAAVFDWIKANWPIVVGVLTGGIGLAVAEIIQHWQSILDFFKKIPGWIADAAKGMWDGIANAFVDMINFVIHVWNGLQFKIPTVGFGPFRTPGFTLGLPNIPDVPHLAQGGLITQTGLVFAHAGEAITPIDRVPRGPAVVINDAHFASEVDVDLFMRRVAWTVQTQAV